MTQITSPQTWQMSSESVLWPSCLTVLAIADYTNYPQPVVSSEFCSRGVSRSESHLALGLQKRLWLKFFATAWHSNSNQWFFSWPKSIYYCDLSVTNCTFIKLELRVQVTHFYGDTGEFDGCRGIKLGIWSQWLYHGTDDKLALVVTVVSIVTGIMG